MDKIKHFKLTSCRSTQDFLHNYRPLPEKAICSTIHQTAGRGRGTHSWENFAGSLAFSFTLTPAPILTLTSLEVAVLLIAAIQKSFPCTLQLKWPNDILNQQGEKVGGILLQHSKLITVGIGLNWSGNHPQYPSIFPTKQLSSKDYHDIPQQLVNYIYAHRLQCPEIIEMWNKQCFHLNKHVKIDDESNSYQGEFIGIGQLGQALLQQENTTLELFNGHLTIWEQS